MENHSSSPFGDVSHYYQPLYPETQNISPLENTQTENNHQLEPNVQIQEEECSLYDAALADFLEEEGASESSSSVVSVLGSGTINQSSEIVGQSKDWLERCLHEDFPDEEFKRLFHMSKATFNMFVQELKPTFTKQDTTLRAAVPVHQRAAVCIWKLATGDSFQKLSMLFGLGVSTCHQIFYEVCRTINQSLMPKFIQWPNNNATMCGINEEFKVRFGIPYVAGSLYTTHINVDGPTKCTNGYTTENLYNKYHTQRNQRTTYTVTIQGVFDPNGVLIDVSFGCPGSYADEMVLMQSTLVQKANMGYLNNVWVVGNSNYSLMDWVLVPYSHQNVSWVQAYFNEKIRQIQKVAKDSFFRMKKRWGCLQKRNDVREVDVVLRACCVLHNICEIRKEELIVHDQPAYNNNFIQIIDDEVLQNNVIVRSMMAFHVRDQIANSLYHQLDGTSSV